MDLIRKYSGTEKEFDVAIIDWQMPQMDGMETVRQIRNIVGKNVLVVIMSAYDWSDIENKAREVGVDLFMAKPIDFDEVSRILQSIVKDKQKLENNLLEG